MDRISNVFERTMNNMETWVDRTWTGPFGWCRDPDHRLDCEQGHASGAHQEPKSH